MNVPEPHVIWLFGLSGAGKSTLADRLCENLRLNQQILIRLDGDALRSGLCRGLGFSLNDRAENIRRAAETAKIGLQSGVCVVASFITPLETFRQLAADIVGREHISFVHVAAPLNVCRSRDVKGLYAKASAGSISDLTGVSSEFEDPLRPDLVLETSNSTVSECAMQLTRFALSRINGIDKGQADWSLGRAEPSIAEAASASRPCVYQTHRHAILS
jgi:adenylyl-sulfate kinase